jgi:hypothetical protein
MAPQCQYRPSFSGTAHMQAQTRAVVTLSAYLAFSATQSESDKRREREREYWPRTKVMGTENHATTSVSLPHLTSLNLQKRFIVSAHACSKREQGERDEAGAGRECACC